jgi:hypothetical protein
MDEDDGDVNAIERQVETVDRLFEARSSSWSRPNLFSVLSCAFQPLEGSYRSLALEWK